jgi:two-component system, sensor histidine kinase
MSTDSPVRIIPAELARSALDAAPDAMIIIDEAGIVRYANRQLTALFGYSHEEIVGESVEQLMPERFRRRHAGHRKDYFAVLRVRPMGAGLALFGRRRDGSEFPVEISLSPVRGASRTLVAAAIRDVTDRNRTEAELTSARESAERARQAADHLRQVADQARESADRANQAKSRFLATASHDLRQPLQTLALLNGTLRRMVSDRDTAEIVSQQQQAIGAMSRLMNALLDISKLESGAVKPQPADFRIATLLERLRQEFAGIAAEKGLALTAEPSEESVHSDPTLVGQIMRNLVSNAIKYTREGRVVLRCRRQARSLRIDVLDTGVGIPAAQLAHIYDEFYQVGVPANSSREGYGLGLSIVQRLVRLLSLRLEVMSEVGRGSVFSLILPLGRAPGVAAEPEAGASPRPPSPSGSPRVLLVEDDASVRDATRMLLRVEGYQVTAVASLSDAMHSAAAEGAPDVLITDYHLRDGELGTQVIAALRESLGRNLKAVLLTGDTSAVVKAMLDDPDLRIISKPVEAEVLLGLLRALLSD